MGFKVFGADKVWEPTKKQAEFLQIPDTVPEALFGGAAGGGKTDILVLLPILREWHKHPGFRGIIFRRTYPEIEESLWPRALDYYRPLGAAPNETKHTFKFPSGAVIKFGYSNKIEDIKQHDSSEYQYIGFDEVTHFDPYQYLYMGSRNRSSYPELPAIRRCATNPGGIGHTFFRDRFVSPYRFGGRLITDEKGNKRVYVHATVYDNPHIANRETYIKQLEDLPEAERKAKLEGDWFSFEGQVFTEWREYRYPKEPDNALHICDPFVIPSYWPKILSVDWGYSAKTCAHWTAISPDGRVYFYREYTTTKTSIKTWAADLRRLSQFDENIVAAVLDPSAWKEEGHDKSIAQQAIEASGFNFEKADNARVAGKQNFHDFLRWMPRPPKYVPKTGFNELEYWRIFRMYGSEKASEYQQMFEPEAPETNIPRVQVFKDTCPELVKVIPLCTYPDDDTNGKKKEDVRPFEGDDPYDCARYNLMAADRYVRTCAEEFKRVQELDKILSSRDAGMDQTDFYRRMERYESEHGGNNLAVPRYKRLFHSSRWN